MYLATLNHCIKLLRGEPSSYCCRALISSTRDICGRMAENWVEWNWIENMFMSSIDRDLKFFLCMKIFLVWGLFQEPINDIACAHSFKICSRCLFWTAVVSTPIIKFCLGESFQTYNWENDGLCNSEPIVETMIASKLSQFRGISIVDIIFYIHIKNTSAKKKSQASQWQENPLSTSSLNTVLTCSHSSYILSLVFDNCPCSLSYIHHVYYPYYL
jgi:hypothetical protein